MPHEAYRAWRSAPAGLIEEILEARGYAAAKQAIATAADESQLPPSPWITAVREIEAELVLEVLRGGSDDH